MQFSVGFPKFQIKYYFLWPIFILTIISIITLNNQTIIDNIMKSFWSRKYYEVYQSSCWCRNNELIVVEEIDNTYLGVNSVKNHIFRTRLFNISKIEFNQSILTCNIFSTLRRGKHQKVLSYTLFGKNKFYYDKLKNVTQQIQQYYPDWFMRVYHDSSIDRSIICDLECQTDKDGQLINNSDFCDLSQFNVNLRGMNLTPVNYMLPRMWRFLAIGDSFIDIMMSRDSDSFILQREVDSVDVWLRSNKIAHAMRDHPGHGIFILAGMWGFKNVDNRDLARRIFYLSVDPDIMKVLNPNNIQPKRK